VTIALAPGCWRIGAPTSPPIRVASSGSPGAAPQNLTLKLLAKPPIAIDELAAVMIENGCQSQFERLANATKAADASM